ncbi:carbohydrate porin, partial [Enterobacter hormaechei]
MQLKKMVVLVGALCSGSLFAAQSATSVDEKLAQLEAQIEALKQQQAASQQAAPVVVQSEKPVNKDAPPKLTLSGFGDIKFYGDVEFNMDAASKTGSLTSVKQSANSDWAPGDKERWDINGRILLGFDGYRKMDNGHFSGFSV